MRELGFRLNNYSHDAVESSTYVFGAARVSGAHKVAHDNIPRDATMAHI